MGRAPKGGASLPVILLTRLTHVNGGAAELCGPPGHIHAAESGADGRSRFGDSDRPAGTCPERRLGASQPLRICSAKMLRNIKMPQN
jgi:hypothetical protein